MDGGLGNVEREFTALFLFAGIGAGARGFLDAHVTINGVRGRFRSVGGVDFDALACKDFEALTGSPSLCVDIGTMTGAELRAFEALAEGQDGAEWQSEDDAVSGWGEYASEAATILGVPRDARAQWVADYQRAAEETARKMWRDAEGEAPLSAADEARIAAAADAVQSIAAEGGAL